MNLSIIKNFCAIKRTPKYHYLFGLIITTVLLANSASFSSIKIIPSAREQAMGGAGVISALGPQAMYYNPALTSNLNSFAMNFNYNKWFLDTYNQSIFLVRPYRSLNLGFGIVNFNAGAFELRPDFPTDEILGDFNPVDFNFYFNASRKLNSGQNPVSLGVSARLYYSKIYEESATCYGLDAGLSYQPADNLSIGLSVTNIGTQLRYIREKFSVPRRFAAGANYLINFSTSQKLKFTADLAYLYYERVFNLNSGLEYIMNDKYFFRTGYKHSDQPNHLSAGIGIVVKNLRVEYAFTPYELDLGVNHHISLSIGY